MFVVCCGVYRNNKIMRKTGAFSQHCGFCWSYKETEVLLVDAARWDGREREVEEERSGVRSNGY